MFHTVLIANRGEIACRIAHTLRRLGIRPVTVHSEADAEAPHVASCDASTLIGPPPANQSYLRGDAILEAAAAMGADAIHPGYGFLSENAGFARSVAEAGLTWIGPNAGVIEAMGDKAAARRAAVEAGVPVVPGTDDPTQADTIGYPLLVKASGGGGGIGMKVVKKASKLDRAVESCRDRGRSSFGNDAIYLERLIEPAHHVEVQVLGDRHGGVIHLGERECSVQRRRQKVIEESPSPAAQELGPSFMEELYAAAVALSEHVRYDSAGTVEFIVDPATESFHFIEMNTRLQVEHPVTEERYGVDLVEAQLRMAAGEDLSTAGLTGNLNPEGHAIELRVYAEDPAKKFLPRPGRIEQLGFPPWPTIRQDLGYRAGQDVTPYYDPLLGKIIAHAETRALAVERLSAALEFARIEGIVTNTPLLAAILRHKDFLAGRTPTSWLESNLATLLDQEP